MTRRWSLVMGHGALVVLALGCGSSEVATRRPLQVEASGALAGRTEEGGLEARRLVGRVGDLLAARRERSAAILVARSPEVALEALLSNADPRARAVHVMAEVLDATTGRAPATDGFAALARDHATDPSRLADFVARRQEVLARLREGRAGDAASWAEIPVPAACASQAILHAEAARLLAVSLLVEGTREGAADAGEVSLRAARAAAERWPHLAAGLYLTAAEALASTSPEPLPAASKAPATIPGAPGGLTDARVPVAPAGAFAAGPVEAAWREGARLLGVLLDGPGAVLDPGLWERAISLRPRDASWPEAARTALERRALADAGLGLTTSTRGAAAPSDLLAWSAVGHARLARGEARAALLALSRAEALAPGDRVRDRLRASSARALVRLSEAQAAQSVLGSILTRDDAETRGPALGLTGALELRRGDAARARALLAKALEGADAADPHAADAEANLGLALLSLGREAEGLARLHAAQARFRERGRADALLQALDNEARFLQAEGRPEDAARVFAAMEAEERG